MGSTLFYILYAICVLTHRFYLRYITYSMYLFFVADGDVMSDFNSEVKEKGYSGQYLRKIKWETFKKSGVSQFSYFLSSTINPFIFGGLYLTIIYVCYGMVFGF